MWAALGHALVCLNTLTVVVSCAGLVEEEGNVPAPTTTTTTTLPSIADVAWSWNRRTLKDWRLADIAIVATLDGSLHALERGTGDTRWTISSQDAAVRADGRTAAPFDDRSGDSKDSLVDRGDGSGRRRDTWIVEPIDDGCLYTFNERDGLFKLPFGIKQLVENSPFTVPGDDKVYVGERRTTLYSIDPRTGNVLQAYGTGFGHTSSSAPKCPVRDSLDELDDDNACVVTDPNAKDVLRVGRNTYRLTIFAGPETLWNVTYTEWVPNSVDADLERQYAGTFDGTYISPLYDGKVIAHQTETNDAVWFKDLVAPAVRVYDVLQLQSPATRRGYDAEVEAVALVAQPLDPHFAESNHENYVDGDGSTYIGRTPEGDWFAMSASKCPLVSGAPLSRWSAGTGQGSPDDLLGIHTHNRVADEQPHSPGHFLTIEDASPGPAKLIDDARPPRATNAFLWLTTILCLIVGSMFGVWKFSRARLLTRFPTFNDDASLIPADVSEFATTATSAKVDAVQVRDASPPASVMEKELPKLPRGESSTDVDLAIPVMSQLESPKPKRKRGSRGGKKLRDANQRTTGDQEQEVTELEEGLLPLQVPEPQPAPVIIKRLAAESLPGTDSSFPLQINSLLVTDKILGYGSHGTIVYKGSFEGRDVAVKRMLLDFYDIASHEVVLLQESDDHPNVIRYYCKQENERFLYIALELCAASLAEITERPADFESLIDHMNDVVNVIKQMAQGVQYLHSLKIVHRDLKPQNILVNAPRKSTRAANAAKPDCARIVISDFGLCKKLDADQSSFRATTAQAAGTSGWRAPELLVDDTAADVNARPSKEGGGGSTSESTDVVAVPGLSRKVSRAIDIFSLGCVFYYVLSNGAHPFGDRYMREANIIRDRSDLTHLDILGDLGVLAKDLIAGMIGPDPRTRPDATAVLQHPFFWSPERRLTFLLDVSDRFEIEERDPPSPLLAMLERRSAEVVQGNWYARLDRNLIENLGRYRRYDGASILDLLRALRNKRHHYQDLPDAVQAALGPLPGGFLGYFCGRFPLLLLHAYYLCKAELAHEPMFAPYFSSTDP